jgi:surface protein
MNEIFDVLIGFSKIICTDTSVQGDDNDDDDDEKGNKERKENRKPKMKKHQGSSGVKSSIPFHSFHSFHSLWICVAILLHVASQTMVDAVCAPSGNTNLKLAVNACLSESSTGHCPNFAAASNGAGCNNGGVNGVLGDWDVSQVTSLEKVFAEQGSFNEDISKWDVSSVDNMDQSTFLSFSFSLSFCSCIHKHILN